MQKTKFSYEHLRTNIHNNTVIINKKFPSNYNLTPDLSKTQLLTQTIKLITNPTNIIKPKKLY